MYNLEGHIFKQKVFDEHITLAYKQEHCRIEQTFSCVSEGKAQAYIHVSISILTFHTLLTQKYARETDQAGQDLTFAEYNLKTTQQFLVLSKAHLPPRVR